MSEQRVRAWQRRLEAFHAWVLPVLVVAALVVSGWAVLAQRGAQDRADRDSARVDALAAALTKEQRAAEAEGRDPVAPPPEDIVEDPGVVEQPPPQVDTAQIVREVLAQLPPPREAPPPTQAQVDAAVTRVCAARACAPTDEQVATEVAMFLTANPPAPGSPGQDGTDGAPGADGQPGQDGAAGQDGVGIADVTLQQNGPDCVITVVLTDGSTRDLAFQCRPEPGPPDPTGTPLLPPLGD